MYFCVYRYTPGHVHVLLLYRDVPVWLLTPVIKLYDRVETCGVTNTFPPGHTSVTVSETGHTSVTVSETGHTSATVSETGHNARNASVCVNGTFSRTQFRLVVLLADQRGCEAPPGCEEPRSAYALQAHTLRLRGSSWKLRPIRA